MKRLILFCMTILLLHATGALAQDSYNERCQKYIDQYSTLAMKEQQKNGIPAAITLGQGILETEAGASELMTEANNHFGIKCGNGWLGPTFSHTDDAPDECFKKYKCAEESFRDHSDHLKRNPRYAPLFRISETDYASWAICLKKCGYATNPQYAQRLIKIIEDFKLQEYTYSALNGKSQLDYPAAVSKPGITLHEDVNDDTDKKNVVADTAADDNEENEADALRKTADSARNFAAHLQEVNAQAENDSINNAVSHNFENSKLITVNGLQAFYAYKGEMLLQYAVKFNVRYPKLLEINELPDAPLAFDTYIYVEKKRAVGTHSQHAVKEGESLLMIAQTEGMQLKRLMALNLLNPNEEPGEGAILQLEFPARQKPMLRGKETDARKSDIAATGIKNSDDRTNNLLASAPAPEPVKKAVPAKQVAQADADVDNDKATSPTELPVAKNVIAAEPGNSGAKSYTVKKGDTAFSIAKRNNITLDQLIEWNDLGDGGIKVGQILKVQE